ncbi:hypothetical protein [Methylobacterium oryzisoli]|uniref:hypothetical protein n=1 Tax=Methylobacterium oryzisoli TaxID=3385502 RepID=UPI0038913E98
MPGALSFSRRTARLRTAAPLTALLVLAAPGSVTAQAPNAPVGVIQLDERRAPVILGRDGAATPDGEIIDESALRYYASLRQTERVQAEIARLRRRYPNWKVPTDLDTLKPSPPEEAPMWDLFTAGRFGDLRAAITARQAIDPGWQPSEDLARKLNRGTLRTEVKAAAREGAWTDVIARVRAIPDAMRSPDIDIAWLVAEAYARTGDTGQAAGLYRGILASQRESALRLATIQKAMAVLPIAQVEPLLALGQPAADGTNEFAALRLDVTRARIVAVLHDEAVGRIEAGDVAALSDHVRRLGDPDQLSLLGWYAYQRRQFREALDWFKAAIARGGGATVATGLALALREVGQERDAEEVAYAWRAASVTNTALYIDMMERRLTQVPVATLDAPRLDRFAKVVLATSSGEGAQALGWYAYNACQFDAAIEWFERATAWKPREAAVLGYALSLARQKRTRDSLDVVNRYDGLFPKLVDLVFAVPEEGADPGPCAPARANPPPQRAVISQATARVPKPAGGAGLQPQALPVKRSDFPHPVAAENPLRFTTLPSGLDRGREGDFLRETRTAPPLIARRVPGVGPMPYERYGYSLLPGWNGADRPTLQGGLPPPAIGTLAHADQANAPSGGQRLTQTRDGDRFGPFDAPPAAVR